MPAEALERREPAVAAMALMAAAILGALAAADPKVALALAGGCILVALPFVAPVTHLALLLAITAIVPFDVQNAVALGGGPGRPGILPSDVLLAAGLARAAVLLIDVPLERRARWIVRLAVAVLGIAVVQALHGLRSGYDPGTVGTELRALLGFGAALIAIPILVDSAARARLFKALIAIGLAIGIWGIVQWTIDIPFTAAGDAGVRAGVRLTTEGRGQIQGGLYAFPVVVVMGVAALLSHELRSRRTRALLAGVVALNAVDLLLTYERSFWVATLVALVVLALQATPRQRLRALIVGPALLAVVVAAMAFVAPRDVAAARQRLLSIRDYGSDLSVRYRLTETANVTQAIDASPLRGSGLGAAIIWGRPYEEVLPKAESFAHNGYLWLAWKLGVPGAAVAVLFIATAVLLRGPPPATTTYGALRAGARSSLVLLLVTTITFPSFNTVGITAVMGVLAALCAAPRGAADRSPQEAS